MAIRLLSLLPLLLLYTPARVYFSFNMTLV